MIKKLMPFFICLLINLNIFHYSVYAVINPPIPSADSAVLMDGITGEILYSKNPNTAYPPASTTKVLTTLLSLENCELDDIVTVGEGPSRAEGSSIYLLPGEQATVRDVLYGLNLQSGNDCAEALAEHIAGSKEKFAELMNSRAKELGCSSSNFVNPSGLYNKNHKTSAKDLALILKELIKYPDYFQIASTLTYVMEPNNKSSEKRYIWNKNKLILPSSNYYYKGAKAGKTGYTTESKHSYVAVAEKDGQILIVTLIHDETSDSYKDTRRLFDYGFSNFETTNLVSENDKLQDYVLDNQTTIPVLAGSSFFYSKEKTAEKKPEYIFNIEQEALKNKSIKKGDKIGSADIVKNGKTIGSIDLLSGKDHEVKLTATTSFTSESTVKTLNKNSFTLVPLLLISLLLAALIKFRNIRIKDNWLNLISKLKNRK